MSVTEEKLNAIPTNIITGFLGVGKTTTILHLLKQKPSNERWAVLVNEFGEVGIDGSLLQGSHSEESGVFIREVPGGCMCCAAGLPMHIALNQLLARAKPDRLLIEPSGLGHPKEVLEVLSAKYYKDVLDIQKNITLVDARKLHDKRYTGHNTFVQQIDIADVVIGNKQDLYQVEDRDLLHSYLKSHRHTPPRVIYANHGQINPNILYGPSEMVQIISLSQPHFHGRDTVTIDNASIPDSGYLKVQNSGEGYHSIGWRFSASKCFDHRKIYAWLSGLQVQRMKAVFITDEGIYAYNMTSDALTQLELDECNESKIEIIAFEINEKWEQALFDCLVSTEN